MVINERQDRGQGGTLTLDAEPVSNSLVMCTAAPNMYTSSRCSCPRARGRARALKWSCDELGFLNSLNISAELIDEVTLPTSENGDHAVYVVGIDES